MSDTLIQTAVGFHRSGKFDEAAKLYAEILHAVPDNPDALYLLGSLHFQRGEYQLSLDHFHRALAARPDSADIMAAYGAALSTLARHEEALVMYDKVIGANPTHAQSWNNRGNALLTLGRAEEAIASYERALGLMPHYIDAWRNCATALLQCGRYEDALLGLDKALRLKPDFLEALEDRATLLTQLGRREEAIAAYDRALALNPNSAFLLYNRGNAHAILEHYDEAIRDCEAVLSHDPDYPYARGVLVHCKLQSCQWRGLDRDIWNVSMALAAGKRVLSPFNLKALSDLPQEHLRVAQIWMTHEAPPASRLSVPRPRTSRDRIRLAYVSGDFNNSAVATLMAGVFEHHDLARFETIAVSFGSAEKTPMRKRLEGGFENFIDVCDKSDGAIAMLLRDMDVDIAVDLMGYTGQCRTRIFAGHPAALQVNYLGFPGTMGAPYMDYIVADPTVVPEDQWSYYTECVACLPHCYLPSDRTRAISANVPSRAEVGLPDRGFIFASFNNAYKFAPATFDVWMRLLRNVDGSVLWLSENNAFARRNLTQEAQSRGVDPERLIFAPLVPGAPDHLARLSLADLFLDTLPYNAHTSASDSLWAGVPVLTLMGNSFAARVAASALRAVEMNELITKTAADYEAIALRLARDPAQLGAIRVKLRRNRLTTPLFDTARFTRDLEKVFATMWERHERGEAPASFAVASAD
jgi:protein O-GlcNAc transferase